MQIVSIGDNLHEMLNSVFWVKNKKHISMFPAEIFTQSAKRLCIYMCCNVRKRNL